MNDFLSEELLIPTLDLASKRSRWLASMIDYLLYLAIFMVISLYFGKKYTTEDGEIGYHTAGLTAFCILSFGWILLPVLEGTTGQTLGKALFKIKTVKEDGGGASIGNCIVRHLFDIIDFVPFFLVLLAYWWRGIMDYASLWAI
jgi:uncharacterized RDD family membrane protein YckC